MRMTIKLTPNEVSMAIKDWVRNEIGEEPCEVIIDLLDETVGYGMSEHQKTKFNGATVVVKEG